MAKRTVRQIKSKKRKWVPVYSSKDFGELFLGELFVPESKHLEGKSLTINLMDITGNSRNQNVNIGFRVEKVEEGKAFAIPVDYRMIQAGIKRFIRRGKTRLDDSFVSTTSDKKRIRIKFILVTRSKTKSSVTGSIRKSARYFLNKMIAGRTYTGFYHDLVSYKIQKSLKSNLKKIYPLGVCEIRAVELDKRPVRIVKKEEVKEEKVEEKEVKKEEKEEKITEKEEEKEEVKEEKKPEEIKEEKEEVKEEKKPEEIKEEKKEKEKEVEEKKEIEKKPAKVLKKEAKKKTKTKEKSTSSKAKGSSKGK